MNALGFWFKSRLRKNGVAVLRRFLQISTAHQIEVHFARNLERSGYPDLHTNASRNAFPLAMAFEGIPDLQREVINRLERRLSFLGNVRVAENSYARFELARPNSPYDFFAMHQDATPALNLNPKAWTAWLALSPCGKDAPSLQYVNKKFASLVPTPKDQWFFDSKVVADLPIRRPIFAPGDLVVFNAYTVHGTWITREMIKPRYSLDLRLA